MIHFRFPVGQRRSKRLTANLGLWLGSCFAICFATGLLSHLIQHPPGWFWWPSRPVQLYRITQGVHVATGIACIPLLSAKVWSVYPKLFEWPPVRNLPHALERASIGLLSAAAVFELVTGVLNIAYWYSAMPFGFIAAHYWTAWLAIGALVLHIAVKLPVIRNALTREPARGELTNRERRRILAVVAGTVGVITLTTVGQTLRPLRRLSLLAPRIPDVGPQGVPVNKTARAAQVKIDDSYRLVVTGPGGVHALSLADLDSMPQHTVSLPISCVEGWSAEATWTGIRVQDLVKLVGGTGSSVTLESLEIGGAYRVSTLDSGYVEDPLTLIALELNGQTLDPDHGHPARLIAPNRPGVLQTKWLGKVTVT